MVQPISLSSLYNLLNTTTGVCTDTRQIKSGGLFISLRGMHFDGNQFAEEALHQGCRYAVVDDPSIIARASSEDLKKRLLYYEGGGLQALRDLAAMHRGGTSATYLAITGTNGKTTTKELIYTILSARYRVHATRGNFNNEIGVPLTLLEVAPDDQFAVIELGASHIGDIISLAELVRPEYGLITNIGRAHLAGFGSLEGVKRTKGELYNFLLASGGRAFCNGDDPILVGLLGTLEAIFYGDRSDSRVAGRVSPREDGLLEVVWIDRDTGHEYTLVTHLVGDYNLTNVLAAIAVGLHFDLCPEEINSAIASYYPSNHRSQILPLTSQGNRVILDCYNANPSSMEMALSSFFSMPMRGQSHLLVLGDMNELGEVSAREHRAIMRQLQDYLVVDPQMVVYLCGPEFFALQSKFTSAHFVFFPNSVALKQYLDRHRPQNRFILIKGSNSHHLSLIAELC